MMTQPKDYAIPEAITAYLAALGYDIEVDVMMPFINRWYHWYKAEGDFYDYNKVDGTGGAIYKYHRKSTHPAARVCREWASLLLNEEVKVACKVEATTDWLMEYLNRVSFFQHGQETVAKAFAMGTGAWALWLSFAGEPKMHIRRYDARMVIPLSHDDDGVTECAFVSQAKIKGKLYDQLQLHVQDGESYHIRTAVFYQGKAVELDGIMLDFDTHCPFPTFAVVRPGLDNTRVDFSPYGESVFADAVDAIQAVDLCFDAIFTEVDLSKMRLFVGDMLLDVRDENGKQVIVPFGQDDVVFRKVAQADTTRNLIETFAPQLRTDDQLKAYNKALQTLGDLCGFGLQYFAGDKTGGIRTATEVSSDNSDLMRNIKKHENALQEAIVAICQAVIFCGREWLGEDVPEPGEIRVLFDDSIVTDTAAEKSQDLLELDRTLNPWEYRVKWYGEDEATAKANVPGAVVETVTDFE
jgi:A118 family predicted phage portal protein